MTDTDKDHIPVEHYMDETDEVMDICLDQQIICMYLQYVASATIKNNIVKGMTMLNEIEKVRNQCKERQKEIESVLSESAIQVSQDNIDYYPRLYSQLADEIIAANEKHSGIPPRPSGAEYACAEKASIDAAFLMAKDYFPELYN